MRWNRDLAGDLGLIIEQPSGRLPDMSWREHERFELRQAGSLEFHVGNGNLQSFVAGSLQARGGYVLKSPSGDIDLTDFRIRTRDSDPLVLDLVGADGQAWFYVDRLMYEIVEDNRILAVREMDLRISQALATRIGHPEVANWAIADMQMTTQVLHQGSGAAPNGGGVYDWHGTPAPNGGTYQADLFMQVFTPQYSRCTGCTGVSPTSQVVFTPSSTLRNNVNNGSIAATIPGDPMGTSTALWTADIPWYQKFSGTFAPYGNDQHPYLIWNMYRVNADGSIDQIGRSGVKHAFLTTNQGCASGHGGNSHVLGLQCSDTYGTGNNDSNSDLGPRSEIIPATNQWGRCGSIYDTNCDGGSNSSGNGNYSQRLIVAESQIAPGLNAGASYLFESWYLAREDINIYNSMATKSVTPSWGGSVWNTGTGTNYRLGSGFDRWYELATPASSKLEMEIVSGEGHTKVGVKVFDLGGGSWRYDYVVMNYDFARPFTEGSEPNLRVVHNFGFDQFSLPVSAGITVSSFSFSDGDMDPGNDWTVSNAGGTLRWSAPLNPNPPANTPAVLNPLNWGTMYRFSFVADSPSGPGGVNLHVAESGVPQTFAADVLVPANDTIFVHGFE
ncbi:hypothetical protein [Dokdonella sp.]|uniref:hypothetical protein n=1 Tax=Dokdonella sp. TaxID=2291710 RepID=UPI003C487763